MPNIPEIQIAKKLYFSQQGKSRQSRPAVRVALVGIIVGVVVMILTFCVVIGFKQTIASKVAGFGAHIQIVSFENNDTYDLQPIEVPDSMLTHLRTYEHVTGVAPFVTKPGMLKTDSAFHGMVLKGSDYWPFFERNMIEGRLPETEREVLISALVAKKMQVNVGDSILSYYVGEKRGDARILIITGLYDTGFSLYDELFVLTPLITAKRLQNWDDAEHEHTYSGVEIQVDDMSNLYATYDKICGDYMNHFDEFGTNVYYVKTIEQMNPAIFSWLDLLDMNVVVIIVLMLVVAGFNIISGLIILILEGVQLIGTLKALGADNRFVRRIFIVQASMLIGKGVLWGNIIGLGLAALQYFFHLIPLEAATYYVDTVPVAFPWAWLVLLNILTVLLSMFVLLLPSMIITRISPAKVMHFE